MLSQGGFKQTKIEKRMSLLGALALAGSYGKMVWFSFSKGELQKAFEALGELIEYFWDAVKHYSAGNGWYTFQGLKLMLPTALDSFPRKHMREYWNRIVYDSHEFKPPLYTKYEI